MHIARLRKDPDWIAVGGLSQPSKMPGFSYSIPSADCVTGTKLRAVKGSTRSRCYAHKRGNYRFRNVQAVLARRRDTLSDLDAWRSAMIRLLPRVVTLADPVFRWHDSGDVQSVEHLGAIVDVAIALPMIRFWLPTREYAMVRSWLVAGGIVPGNLTIRMSAPMVGRPSHLSPAQVAQGLQTSTVGAGVGSLCGAWTRDNECGPCRACWSKDVPNVDYPQH